MDPDETAPETFDSPPLSQRRRSRGHVAVSVHLDADMLVADVSKADRYRTMDIVGPSGPFMSLFFSDLATAQALRAVAEAIIESFAPPLIATIVGPSGLIATIDPGPIATIEHREGER